MRIADISDYLALRRLVRNPAEVVRFRYNRDANAEMAVRMRDVPPVYLRGGRSDYHMFHRIFLRDEYRLSSLGAGRLGCVVDLGGNVGLFSARIAPAATRVVACEPMPVNLLQLEKNTSALRNVVVLPAAVAAQNGTIRLFAPKAAKRSGSFSTHRDPEHHDPEAHHDVNALRLEDIFQQQDVDSCDLLKLDVEGSEYEILGTLSASGWKRIQRIHGEYHDVSPEDPHTRWENFAALLESKGFRVESSPHRRKPNHGMFFAWRRHS